MYRGIVAHDVGTVFVLRVVVLLAVDYEAGIFVPVGAAVELPECIFVEAEIRAVQTSTPVSRRSRGGILFTRRADAGLVLACINASI